MLTSHPSRDVGRVRARFESITSELDDILEEASSDGERSTWDVDDGTVAHVRRHLLGTGNRIASGEDWRRDDEYSLDCGRHEDDPGW